MQLREIGFEWLIFQMRDRFEKQKKTILYYIFIIVKVLMNFINVNVNLDYLQKLQVHNRT